MKTRPFFALLLAVFVTAGLAPSTEAQIKRQPKTSLLDNDPEVVYREEFSEKPIELLVVKAGQVFPTKNGGRARGNLRLESKVELLGITERAYNIRGTLSNGQGVSGWVSPQALASRDKDFVENLKKLYQRQIVVREHIKNGEVVLGMTPHEVSLVFGQPTKSTTRETDKGRTGSWEFIEYREEKHYQLVRNPITGQVFRQLTHTTQEEVSKVKVDFENEMVTAIEQSENKPGRRSTTSVPAPIFILW